jgi:hypothetical protein
MQAGKYNKPKIENFKKLSLYLAKVEQIKKINNDLQRSTSNAK